MRLSEKSTYHEVVYKCALAPFSSQGKIKFAMLPHQKSATSSYGFLQNPILEPCTCECKNKIQGRTYTSYRCRAFKNPKRRRSGGALPRFSETTCLKIRKAHLGVCSKLVRPSGFLSCWSALEPAVGKIKTPRRRRVLSVVNGCYL